MKGVTMAQRTRPKGRVRGDDVMGLSVGIPTVKLHLNLLPGTRQCCYEIPECGVSPAARAFGPARHGGRAAGVVAARSGTRAAGTKGGGAP
ncbi:hypothetical protein GCM10010515_48030 [Streptomyces fructofermentans]|uniref:Uncharacterized protein n=1 Tax=Streptomyces fructofermentans TaxID=152141 RepID=A0A918KUZ8_9ACTN|nr:hypothetical protein GCM10010515_48030 [Streptomyces fructofermentans]